MGNLSVAGLTRSNASFRWVLKSLLLGLDVPLVQVGHLLHARSGVGETGFRI